MTNVVQSLDSKLEKKVTPRRLAPRVGPGEARRRRDRGVRRQRRPGTFGRGATFGLGVTLGRGVTFGRGRVMARSYPRATRNPMAEAKEWVTAREAAVLIGRHVSQIYRRIDAGRLASRTNAAGVTQVMSKAVLRVEPSVRRGRPRGSVSGTTRHRA